MELTLDTWMPKIRSYYTEQGIRDLDMTPDEYFEKAAPFFDMADRIGCSTYKQLQRQGDLLATVYLQQCILPSLSSRVLASLAQLLAEHRPFRVLDAGCGIGLDACFLAGEFLSMSFDATDISPNMIRLAEQRRSKLGLVNIEIAACAHEDLPNKFPSPSQDLIFFNGSIFNCLHDDPLPRLRLLAPLLNPGGRLVIIISPDFSRSGLISAARTCGFTIPEAAREFDINGIEVCSFYVFRK